MASNDPKKINKNNQLIRVILMLLVITIIFVVCFLFATGYFNKERKVTKSIGNLGTTFYEKFYYDKVAKDEKEASKFLKQFKDVGVVVSLYNMKKYASENNKGDIEVLKNAKCDEYKTTVSIYPKSPYKKTNYVMKANLNCKTLK